MTISSSETEFWDSGRTLKALAEGGYFSAQQDGSEEVWPVLACLSVHHTCPYIHVHAHAHVANLMMMSTVGVA